MPWPEWRRWWIFIGERFAPVPHGAMIAAFFLAHRAHAAALLPGAAPPGGPAAALLGLATLAFFFKLRLCDELKDHAFDLRHNPDRPLARGLLTRRDLHAAIGMCVALEIAGFAAAGPHALPLLLPALAYTLLMYREFFGLAPWLRPRLTTYALTHTFVSSLWSLALLSALGGRAAGTLDGPAGLFALATWPVFNVFEFGRKTFAGSEERPGVASYATIWGRWGAVGLTLAMAAAAWGLWWGSGVLQPPAPSWLVPSLGAMTLALAGAGAHYAMSDCARSAGAYRAASSAYLFGAYAALGACGWLRVP